MLNIPKQRLTAYVYKPNKILPLSAIRHSPVLKIKIDNCFFLLLIQQIFECFYTQGTLFHEKVNMFNHQTREDFPFYRNTCFRKDDVYFLKIVS